MRICHIYKNKEHKKKLKKTNKKTKDYKEPINLLNKTDSHNLKVKT